LLARRASRPLSLRLEHEHLAQPRPRSSGGPGHAYSLRVARSDAGQDRKTPQTVLDPGVSPGPRASATGARFVSFPRRAGMSSGARHNGLASQERASRHSTSIVRGDRSSTRSTSSTFRTATQRRQFHALASVSRVKPDGQGIISCTGRIALDDRWATRDRQLHPAPRFAPRFMTGAVARALVGPDPSHRATPTTARNETARPHSDMVAPKSLTNIPVLQAAQAGERVWLCR